MIKATVILPALNEAESIGHTIDDVKENAPPCHIIVVDNGSYDGTGALAAARGAMVITEALRGKGNAVKKGFRLVATPYVILMDSDYTYPARYIRDMVELLDEGYEVVMGERHIRQDNAMNLINLFGNRVVSLLGSVLYWYWSSDICTGLWGFRTEALERMHITSNGFSLEANFFSSARLANCKIARVPIAYRARINNGHSKLKIRDGFGIGWLLIKKRVKIG